MSEQTPPRYPLYDPEATYADDEPLYAERFSSDGGVLRVRAYAPQIADMVATFEKRHLDAGHTLISRAEWPAARAAEEKRGALHAVLNEQIAAGADADTITKAVSAAEAAFKPREYPNFDPTATPED